MPDQAHLPLLLDGPLQAWGCESRFQRRTTGLQPTKSGVIGLLCAMMGLVKGSPEEREWLPRLAALRLTTVSIPRQPSGRETESPPVRRLEDFHTVLDTRRASGTMNKDPVVTRRQYLLDARFGIILSGDAGVLARVGQAAQDPRWGVWLGRKSCIPSEPLHRGGPFSSETEAWRALIGDASPESLARTVEVARFADGTDSFNDQPISFGDGTSSGPDKRQFTVRRVKVIRATSPDSP